MYNRLIPLMSMLMALVLAACSGGSKVSNEQFAFFNPLDITVNDDMLLGDTLALPDVYCGDPNQQLSDLKGEKLNSQQHEALIVPLGHGFPDTMSDWRLLGVRDMGNGITLGAFYAGNGMGYNVDLITFDKQGHPLDAINARELHIVWRIDFSNPNDNTSFSLDSYITFDGDKLSLHRLMSRCVMDFVNDLKGKPQWQAGWKQDYTINSKGLFVLHGQEATQQQGPVDEYAVMEFKSWDMQVCSLYDTSVMDVWNDYAALIHKSFAPDYPYNPFPQDVAELYKMNPQRFLNWLAQPQNRASSLARYFKMKPSYRSELLHEIANLDDAEARLWLNSLVKSWDDKPLTLHP